jgi:NAD-dependent SIR2 family protein deacetylase
MLSSSLSALSTFLERSTRLFVITGAGCSTESGIPAYRDASGEWARKQPVTWQAFSVDPFMRKRYWARSMVGWRAFGRAQPNAAHVALAKLEQQGRLTGLVTQNVDGLHQSAGHQAVVDLHGRLDTVVCLDCQVRVLRSHHQRRLEDINPDWIDLAAARAPDGDAELESDEFDRFHVPPCRHCGGTLKPDVVFFGESVPGERVKTAMNWLDGADAMLIVGSSLMVYSGFRYARHAAERVCGAHAYQTLSAANALENSTTAAVKSALQQANEDARRKPKQQRTAADRSQPDNGNVKACLFHRRTI